MDEMLHIRCFEPNDEAAVVDLWQRCGLTMPWNDPHKDIARKLACEDGLFLVGLSGNHLIASVMGGYDGHRGWIYYLAVAPEHQERGYAREIIARLESALLERGCPKVQLMVRESNLDIAAFYSRIGYSADNVVTLSKRLIADN